ncbi:hypothetical protein Tco_1209784 [Tanacetum coccineum]
MGCCLTSWFSKKQTALAISTTEAEYVSAKKACQQALWMISVRGQYLFVRSLFNSVQVVRLACSIPIGVPEIPVCASTAVVRSAISCRMASKVMAGVSDVDVLLGGILSTEDNT